LPFAAFPAGVFLTPALSLILLSAGSEVPLIVAAQGLLAAEGIRARVVSMPSTEIFDRQPQSYRDEVLPLTVRHRLAVETGVAMSWYRYVGLDGDVLALNHYGASAPYKTLYEKFGFTPNNIVARAKALLGK